MVSGNPPAQGRFQFVDRGVDVPVGQRGQGLGHGLTGDEGLDDSSAAEAQNAGHHRIELDVGILQRLLDTVASTPAS